MSLKRFIVCAATIIASVKGIATKGAHVPVDANNAVFVLATQKEGAIVRITMDAITYVVVNVKAKGVLIAYVNKVYVYVAINGRHLSVVVMKIANVIVRVKRAKEGMIRISTISNQ